MPIALFLVSVLAAEQVRPLDNSPEAYRLDALRTKALNDAAIERLRDATTVAVTIAAPRAPTAAEIDLATRERAAIQAWRARRSKCLAGKRSSCD